jgi:hypothetical protein
MADDQVNGTFIGLEPAVPMAQLDDEMNEAHSVEPPALREQDDEMNTETLRNAAPLPDSDSDSENLNPPNPEPSLAIVSRPRLRNYNAEALVLVQRFGLHTLLFLQLVWTFLSRAASTTQTLSVGVVRSLQTQLYVFFQNIPYPYRAQTTTLAGPGVPPVEWYYNADTKVFLCSNLYNTTHEYHTHHLEWLSGEIRYNDLVLYDVSEYLQQVRWAGTARPNPSVLLAAWSIHSGIVLNLRDGLVLQTINEDGSESSLQLRA